KLVWCPAGRFIMGSPASESGRHINESQAEVTLTRGFWLGKYVLTQSQWRQVTGAQPWEGNDYVGEGTNVPATHVSWEDAMEFGRELTVREQRTGRLPNGWLYTLPTEAQWEYACRAGSSTAYSFGDDASRLGDYAWHRANALDIGEHYAHE